MSDYDELFGLNKQAEENLDTNEGSDVEGKNEMYAESKVEGDLLVGDDDLVTPTTKQKEKASNSLLLSKITKNYTPTQEIKAKETTHNSTLKVAGDYSLLHKFNELLKR